MLIVVGLERTLCRMGIAGDDDDWVGEDLRPDEPTGASGHAVDELIELRAWVPRTRLAEIYAFLGALLGVHAVAVPRNGAWTQQQVADLAASMDGRAREFVRLIAHANGDWVSYQAAADALRVPVDRLRLDLARVSYFAKRVRGEKIWPLEPRVKEPDAELGRRVSYRMDPVIAAWWIAAEGKLDAPNDNA
jgi:hypothetical protein